LPAAGFCFLLFLYFQLDIDPMPIFIAITGALLLLYSLLILYYHWIWDRIPPSKNGDPVPGVTVSVIIPARNEELHIGLCLQTILRQTYPSSLTEIIVVNDFSTDRTASIVEQYSGRVKLLDLKDFVSGDDLNAYKKKAIETGIAQSSGELIACTDADCIARPEWLETLVSAYTGWHCQILAAPVKIETTGSALSVFQALDFISLQGITGAAVYKDLYPMCNGANLAYPRRAFTEVGGFSGIDHIASGDDMLLMGKIQSRFPGRAAFLKDPKAIVSTRPAADLRSFLRQRIRWASKVSHYGHPFIFLTLALVYALNACLLLLFLLSFYYPRWHWLVFYLVLKCFAEFFFVSRVAGFFEQRPLMKYFIFCQPFHILYTVIAGAFGAFGKYHWKDRRVK
jgi:cellulose synthase/poly-beta-1,6-N-acetylglucosamine synthase-like glycosyltransferase